MFIIVKRAHEKDHVARTHRWSHHRLEGSATARGSIWILITTLDPAIATTTTAPVTGTENGSEENGTEIAGTEVTADTIGLGGTRPLTAAETAGQCKTASASRTGGTEQKFVANGGLGTMATTQIEKIEKALQAIKADAVQHDML